MTPKGWTGTFSITKDLVIIYIYDGLSQTENDESMDLNKVAGNIYNNESIFKTLSTKEYSSENEDQLRAKEALSFTNKDESFQIGLWEAKQGQVPALWNYDEFMYGGHPLKLSVTSNGTHGGGSEYTTGVTYNGTPGNAGAYTQITVGVGTPTLYYYCQYHSGMGGQANTP